MKRIFNTLLILLLIVAVSGCQPSSSVQFQINEYHVGEHTLYIPRAYTHLDTTSIGDESGLIQAFYPGSAPVIQNRKILWEQGKWYKNVRIHFDDVSQYKINPEKSLQSQITRFKAFKVVGEQYGLIYRTQPENIKNDHDELWVEKDKSGKVVSRIQCKKKYHETVIPQCSHRFYSENFKYKVSYDKRLLPEWKLIRENVLALMASFESHQAAHDFVDEQYHATYAYQMEETPRARLTPPNLPSSLILRSKILRTLTWSATTWP